MVDTPAESSPQLTVGMVAQRLDGMDKAIELLQSNADKQPSALNVELQVLALKELMLEKFKGVDRVFEERKSAVEAALAAQIDAAAKTEKNFGEQIKQTSENLNTQTGSLQTQINDLKVRLTAVESRTTVTKEVATDSRSLIFAVIGTLIGVGGLIFGLVAMLRSGV